MGPSTVPVYVRRCRFRAVVLRWNGVVGDVVVDRDAGDNEVTLAGGISVLARGRSVKMDHV